MPIPFGFSVGDFLAVADLAITIYEALSEVRGSEKAYKDLVDLLQSLVHSLRTIHNFLISSPSTAGFPPPDVALLNGLRYHLECCQNLMKTFLEESRKFTESFILDAASNVQTKQSSTLFGKSHQKRVVRDLRKIKWSIFNAGDARNLEHRLKSHTSAFEILLVAISLQSQARTQRTVNENLEISRRSQQNVNENLEISRRTEQTLNDMYGYVKTIEAQLQRLWDTVGKEALD